MGENNRSLSKWPGRLITCFLCAHSRNSAARGVRISIAYRNGQTRPHCGGLAPPTFSNQVCGGLNPIQRNREWLGHAAPGPADNKCGAIHRMYVVVRLNNDKANRGSLRIRWCCLWRRQRGSGRSGGSADGPTHRPDSATIAAP